MKLIIAIIKPERMDAVQSELQTVLDEEDKYRLTVQPVEGHGRLQGDVEIFRGQETRAKFVRRSKLTIAVNDKYVEPTIEAIIKGARTGPAGTVGDGKIFIVPMDDCIRIRTGERGGSAI
ncbi:MAG TPA: P-II family nitrogen regulator [Phycisphaerae bacterium]|nr:P-II family nitrogen regulator [Phycisphaerae bacterium]